MTNPEAAVTAPVDTDDVFAQLAQIRLIQQAIAANVQWLVEQVLELQQLGQTLMTGGAMSLMARQMAGDDNA